MPTRNLVRWTGSSWVTFAGGVGGSVADLKVDNLGGLVVGGWFTNAGGVPAANVARFDGTSWTAYGSGLSGVVETLLIAANGDLIVGGDSLIQTPISIRHDIARWNGTSWSPVGTPDPGFVFALQEDPLGLIVGGTFQSVAGVPGTGHLARWDGTAWSSLGMPATWANQLVSVISLLRAANGDLVVGGWSDAYVAALFRFDGQAWSNPSSPKAASVLGYVSSVVELPNGDLIAGGDLTGDDAVPFSSVVRVTPALGSQPLQNGLPLRASEVVEGANGDLFAGCFAQPGYSTVWRRQAGTWAPLTNGPTASIHDLVRLPDGSLVAAAAASTSPGAQPSLSRWDGVTWSSLGALNGEVRDLLVEPNGDLVAGGGFTTIGGVGANGLARWNGSSWSAIAGAPGLVQALLRLPSGELVVATADRVHRQNGGVWIPLGGTVLDVNALTALADGSLVAGGSFVNAGGVPASRVARWNGTLWQSMGNGLSGSVTSLLVLPNGDVLAGGVFVGSTPGLARWNGASWVLVGPGAPSIYGLTQASNGDVLVAGTFELAEATAVKSVLRITTSCPALAVSSGAGCSGSGGANVLTTTSLPWLGSTFRSVASGLASSSIAVHVIGSGPASVSLPTLLPQASAGCVLQVTPDALAALSTNAGSAAVALPIPNVAGLLGLVLRQQVVALELDPFANIVGASAGNVLVLTLGAF